MTNQELMTLITNIKKASILTTTGGQLTAEQSKKFIQTVKDQSWFFDKVCFQPMTASTFHMDAVSVASRQMMAAAEDTAPGSTVNASFPRRTLNTVEVIYPWDISFNFLEENIEQGNAEQTINQAFSAAFANDLLDSAINGDEDSGTAFLAINDGWIDIALADTNAHEVTGLNSSTDYDGVVFPALLDAMPSKWMGNPAEVPILCSLAKARAYAREIAARATGLGDRTIVSASIPDFEGHPVVGVPSWPSTYLMVTPWKNLYLGIGRSLRLGRQVQERSRKIEYTLTAKIDANYAVSDAVVVADWTDNT